jgi:hypothetical protein
MPQLKLAGCGEWCNLKYLASAHVMGAKLIYEEALFTE